jgi:hypothetical protein
MGGGGGGRYIRPSSDQIERKIEKAREEERQRFETDLNEFIKILLARYNDRDREATRDHIESIAKILGDTAEIETILLGGSVAKHTEVDGISDVDALVILDRSDLAGKDPNTVLNSFFDTLDVNLPRSEVESVRKGRLAVTVRYRDGCELQLLPALRSKGTISIASSSGKRWSDTKPESFKRQLTNANQRLNQALVPAIKLVKSIISDLPQQKQLTGYHIEALAVDAAKGYKGPETHKALLLHLLGHAADRILKPISDVTGQSGDIDSYLGKANSLERRNISQALAGMKRRLESATSVNQWRTVFEE